MTVEKDKRMHDDGKHDDAKTWDAFNEVVNMTSTALKQHLDGAESKSVGQKTGGGEATGHAEGRRILAIKDKKKSDLTEDDYAHMRKVVSYVRRHAAQGGKSRTDPHSPWWLSLMNWGHDPSKG